MLIPMMLIPRVPYVFLKCARPFKALLSGRRPSSLVKALINVSKVTECLLKTSMQRTQTHPTWRTTKVLQGAVLARLWNDNIIDVKRKKRFLPSSGSWRYPVSVVGLSVVYAYLEHVPICLEWLAWIETFHVLFLNSAKEYKSHNLDQFGEHSNIRVTPPKLWATQSHKDQTICLKGPGPSRASPPIFVKPLP